MDYEMKDAMACLSAKMTLREAFEAGWKTAVEAAAKRLEQEAKYGCPCNEDERLTWENADILREWAGLPKREDITANSN